MVRRQSDISVAPDGGFGLSLAGTFGGARRLLPIALFTVPFGIAFGVAASEQGLSPVQSIVMSALVFSGAAQFAALDFWREPVAFMSLGLLMLALNGRHVIMGAALFPWLRQLPLRRRVFVLGFLSDANFADSQPAFRNGGRDAGLLLGGGMALWTAWVTGTAIGALGGHALTDLDALGLDVVMVCFFAAVTAPQLFVRSNVAPVLVAAGAAVLTLGWLPAGWNILFGALAGGITALATDAR